ncbi:MAG: hypothetical protein ACU85U_05665 [Gammaproteobacteria bacterium]|jgi:hypothetical protein
MDRKIVFLCVALLSACSGENDRVSGSDPKNTLDEVTRKLDAAGAEAEARIDDALNESEDRP